jgi:ligand-binding sensor domain-containing protein/serine phosphatase RsbU (regulator of sigma subunit)
MKGRTIALLFSLSFFFSAESQTFSFRNFSEENGLIQNYIYHISQSAKGFLVLSTGEGLSTFDGSKFTGHTNKSIAANFITTHFIDSRDIIWLGHAQNGISYYRNGKFHTISHELINEKRITRIFEDDKKNIWFSTINGDIFRIDSTFKFHASGLGIAQSVLSMCFDAENRILAATGEGIKVFAPVVNGRLKSLGEIPFLKNKVIKQIVPVTKDMNAFWIATESHGIYGIRNSGGIYREFAHIMEQLNSREKNISCIYSDKSQNLWVALFGEGLRRITPIGDALRKNYVVSNIDKKNGLKNLHIQSIYQDAEGNMWFGTFGGGLIEKPVEKFSFYGQREKFRDLNLKSIASDSLGNFWIGSENGLARMNRESGNYSFYNSANGFVSDNVNALLVDKQGVLWIGTANHGIYILRPGKTLFENFSKANHLDHMTVNAIAQNRKDVIIGTTEGMYVYDPYEKTVESLTTEDGLLHNNILHIFNDSKNRLWISSHSAVPYYIQNKTVHSFKTIPGLNSFNINAVCEDKEKNIWIATEGDGVFRYDNNKFINYNKDNGLSSDYCYGIAVDGNNSVWVTHKSGLSEKKSSYRDFIPVDKTNGLLYTENNLNSAYKDELNNLWFGTTQGLVHYDSRMGSSAGAEPRLLISKVLMNDVAHFPGQEIIKKYGYYFVHIDFLAISFTDPGSIRYKYRLLGVDSSWKTTSNPYVDFPGLSDGNFNFQLMACSSNGLCTQIPAQIFFRIKAPIWKNTWFYMLLTFMIIFSTYMIIFLRIRSLKKVQVLLQETVRQKTWLLLQEKEEVEKIKIELEHKNKDITDSINYAKRIQDSLLPPQEMMDKLFRKNYFILYKPKDIVSGDFYWSAALNLNNSELAMASVFDCTGHGVPGAFLSIVANDFLKQSLFENDINATSDILNYLNDHICSNLNQSSMPTVRDGMDIALVAIDYKRMKLYYSGANNPAYIYRQSSNVSELIIMKPTRQAIGMTGEEKMGYAQQEMELKPGDTIYLFSDGYVDQFGGGKGKKLGYERFKNILSEAFLLPVDQQKNFLDRQITSWQGNTEQTDDVCIMGIRI